MCRMVFCTVLLWGLCSGEVRFSIGYSQPAQIIDILDNIATRGARSNWEYRRYWQKRFGVTARDRERFQRYDGIRKKYWIRRDSTETVATSAHGLFVDPLVHTQDPIKTVFHRAASVSAALQELETLLSAEESQFLEAFFAEYHAPVMAVVGEFEAYAPQRVASIEAALDRSSAVRAHLQRMTHFYGVDEPVTFRVLVQWWPRVRRGNAASCTVRGNALIIRVNDSRRTLKGEELVSIILHESSHAVELHMDQAKKRRLTDTFLAALPSDSLRAMVAPWQLFEPLAVTIGQMKYLKERAPEDFDIDDSWYANRWINDFSRQLFPLIEPYLDAGKEIDEPFVKELAALYARLMVAALAG